MFCGDKQKIFWRGGEEGVSKANRGLTEEGEEERGKKKSRSWRAALEYYHKSALRLPIRDRADGETGAATIIIQTTVNFVDAEVLSKSGTRERGRPVTAD